jgi:hypothetical protein
MTQLQMFIPLTKVDAERRLVYGVVTAETPDRGDEICDYASSKPHYQKWSEAFRKASGGKSLGNLRAMHGKVAAGRVEEIHFNDAARQIEICAKIVDDAEWRKVEAGVYTGFSQGGAYVKRWPDARNPKLTRYTADPSEISLVDLPCLPGATFTMIKAGGGVETVAFRPQDAAVEQVWRTSDGRNFKKKAEALAHEVALSSMKPMFGALSRMEDDLDGGDAPRRKKAARERLSKYLGREALDAARAVAALEIVFEVLRNELGEGEDDGAQIAALSDAIERLQQFIAAELTEDDAAEESEEPQAAESETLERDAQKALFDELAARLEKLALRIDEIGRQPLPPPMLAHTRAVEKGADPRGEELTTLLAKMGDEERAALMIKLAQSRPQPLR